MFRKLLVMAMTLVRELWDNPDDGSDKLAAASESLYKFVEENDHKLFGALPMVLNAAAVALIDNKMVDNYQRAVCYVIVEQAYQVVAIAKNLEERGLGALMGAVDKLDDMLFSIGKG